MGDSETALFFELQGVETRVIENEAEFQEELKKIKKQKVYGLIVITEEVAEFAKASVDTLRFSKDLPLIVDVPSIKGEHKGKINLSDYIREAIGVKI
ncbi:MAG: V-type ATP synthase subunit F [Brevinematales bacterium]|nr:V-type ATP synthase subunit F [Brevinematales bacterium]